MLKLKQSIAVVVATLTMASALLYLSPPALAAETKDAAVDTVDEVDAAVDEVLRSVAPEAKLAFDETRADVGNLEIDSNATNVVEFESEGGDTTVEIPKDAGDDVVLENAEEEGAGVIDIGMPGDGDNAEVTQDGSVVYESIANDSDLIVEATDSGGVRMMVVIDGDDAPTEYSFDLGIPEGANLQLEDEDGSVSVIGADGETIGVFSAPWAYDANGETVPTSYRVEGTTLVQTVLHEGYAYPVVADPSWWWWAKNIAWCAANIGAFAVASNAKVASTVAKIAEGAKNSRAVSAAVKALGGAGQALKAFFKVIASRVPGLAKIVGSTTSKTIMAHVGTVVKALGKAILLGLVGGSCWDIGAEISPYW